MEGVSFSLAGKVAIITGSGSGIGRSIALGIAQAGADVVVTELPGKAEELLRQQMRFGKEEERRSPWSWMCGK
jgi:2-deoxy-D-gluconate 3-dehydrogenase